MSFGAVLSVRDMFLDPDGYEWKVSQTLRQVSVDEVKQFVSRL